MSACTGCVASDAMTLATASVSTSNRSASPSRRTCATPGSDANADSGASVTTVNDVLVRCRSSASVPFSTATPARMMVTRSHSSSTSLRMWLESSTVAPSAFTLATCARNTASITGSSPLVGSSST